MESIDNLLFSIVANYASTPSPWKEEEDLVFCVGARLNRKTFKSTRNSTIAIFLNFQLPSLRPN